MRVVTAAEAAGIDRWAEDRLGLPGLVLMENAAHRVAEALRREWPAARRIAVACGPGNNGGDGVATARLLLSHGLEVRVGLAREAEAYQGDARVQVDAWRRLGGELQALGDLDVAGCDVVIDALFGTGLSRPLEGELGRWVERLEEIGAPVLAVDLPSGLLADEAALPGPTAAARATVALAAPKRAHLLSPARHRCGRVWVGDLGFPIPEELEDAGATHLLEARAVDRWLPPRRAESHKGDFGHLLVVAGSRGMAGAAVLAGRGALGAGAGRVTVATPGAVRAEVASGAPELMTRGLGGEDEGVLTPEGLDDLAPLLETADALALGPGIGRGERTEEAVRLLLAERPELPTLVDADALRLLRPEALRRRSATVLTPHPGELGALLGETAASIQENRPRAVAAGRERTGAVVVLKGDRTLVAGPRRLWINPTGSPALASAGTGDVLTGVIGALLARGLEPEHAAAAGVFLHGAAGAGAGEARGEESASATDVVAALPQAWRRLRSEARRPREPLELVIPAGGAGPEP